MLGLSFLSVLMKNWLPAERIFMKFDAGELCKFLGTKIRFHWERTKMTGMPHHRDVDVLALIWSETS
jgi:hypothetical protein